MFTPEFISSVHGEFVLVANHDLEGEVAVRFSIEYNRARMAFGRSHVPESIRTCRLIYDIRGQNVPSETEANIRAELAAECILEFRR